VEHSTWEFAFTVRWIAKNRQAEEKQGAEEMRISLNVKKKNQAEFKAKQILSEQNRSTLFKQFKSSCFKEAESFDLKISYSEPILIETRVYSLEV